MTEQWNGLSGDRELIKWAKSSWNWISKQLEVDIYHGIGQCPVGKDAPPVPESMRNHYKEGELDENGYRIKYKND